MMLDFIEQNLMLVSTKEKYNFIILHTANRINNTPLQQ